MITISKALDKNGEREIRVGPNVAYGIVSDSGMTYELSHAPTQNDLNRVAYALDRMSAQDIKNAIVKG